MIRSLALAILLFFSTVAGVAEERPAHKTTADFQRSPDFDFLIGTWDLAVTTNRPNIPPNLKGRWTAAPAADGLLIADEYRIFDSDGKTAYLGMTYRVFNPATKRWDLRYVEPMSGKWFEATAWRDGASMRVQQKGNSESADVMMRFQYYEISDESFRWRSQRSDDGGQNWKPYGLKIEATRVHSRGAEEVRMVPYRKLTPVMVVPRIEEILPLWQSLGFEPTVKVPGGDRLAFAILNSGELEVMIQSRDSVKSDVPWALDGSLFFIEVDALSSVASLLPEGTEVLVARRTTDYGMAEMILRDAAGNVLVFAEKLPESEPAAESE